MARAGARPYGDGVHFSISIHQFDSTSFDAVGVRDYLARAEQLGFEGGWVIEQINGPAPVIAPLEMLAYAAACTERLRLGVAVLVSSLHDPLQLGGDRCRGRDDSAQSGRPRCRGGSRADGTPCRGGHSATELSPASAVADSGDSLFPF